MGFLCLWQAGPQGLWWAESGQAMLTGPWKGGRGAGVDRREPSAIVGSKKRVRVPNFGYPEIVAQIGQRTANIGISMGYVDNLSQNQLFVVNIIRKSRDILMLGVT